MVAERTKPYHVEEWVNGYEFSVTSRRNYFRSVKRCFRWGKKQGYLKSNPLVDLEVPRAENREVAVSPSQFAILIENIRNQCLTDLVRFTWLTGCRPQESVIAECGHLDESKQRLVFRTSESKGRRITRVVYIPDEGMEIVRRLASLHPIGQLFRNTSGKPWTKDSINCAFDAIQVRMAKQVMKVKGTVITDAEIVSHVRTLKPTRRSGGVEVAKTVSELRSEAKRKITAKLARSLAPRYSLYALRHSFATNALRRGVDSLTVAVLLGHRDPSTLARVYQHLNQNPVHLLEQVTKATA